MEDHFYKYLELYKKLPQWLKRFIGTSYGFIPYKARMGKHFMDFLNLAQEARAWSPQEHRLYQEKKLKLLIQHVFRHVPYYRKRFGEAGLSPDDFQTLDDLARFPMLTRDDIRNNLKDLVSDNISQRKIIYKTTSGSSGEPLEFYHQKGITRAKEQAFYLDMFKTIDYKPRDKTVILMGEIIKNHKGLWYYEPVNRNLVMSSYSLNERTIEQYCTKIRHFKPLFIRGYPFMVLKLLNLMSASREQPFPLKGIILVSENVYDAHVNAIRSFFNCPIYHFYGHAERAVIGGICHLSQAYHMSPEYGVVEFLTPEGKCAQKGEQGEIVATSLDNWVMPFIRYRTQDFAVYGGNSCKCGLNFPIAQKILGREEEYVILKGDKKISFHNLIAGIHGDLFTMVKKFQFLQFEPAKLLLRIVPDFRYDKNEVGAIFFKEIGKRVDRELLDISVEYVDDIAVSQNGKTKAFISKV